MRRTFHSEQWLPYPLELVFAFFANPQNLPRLMPSWQQARIEEALLKAPPPRPPSDNPSHRTVAAGNGSHLTLTFKPFPYAPVCITWQAEISDFVWNHRFCDTQLRGPFAFWHHCHTVSPETRAGASGEPIHGTLLCDEIEYEIPFGKSGDLVLRPFIVRHLHRTFAYRHTRATQLLASA